MNNRFLCKCSFTGSQLARLLRQRERRNLAIPDPTISMDREVQLTDPDP